MHFQSFCDHPRFMGTHLLWAFCSCGCGYPLYTFIIKQLSLECFVTGLMSFWSCKSLCHLLPVEFIDSNQPWIKCRSEQRCAMLESSYEHRCFITLLAAESRTSHEDKTLNPSLWMICIEFYSLENKLRGFQGSVLGTGGGGSLCFCVMCRL